MVSLPFMGATAPCDDVVKKDSSNSLDAGESSANERKLIVRNTFIDVSDLPGTPGPLTRGTTEPAFFGPRTGIEGLDEEEDEQEGSTTSQEDMAPDTSVLGPRLSTYDAFAEGEPPAVPPGLFAAAEADEETLISMGQLSPQASDFTRSVTFDAFEDGGAPPMPYMKQTSFWDKAPAPQLCEQQPPPGEWVSTKTNQGYTQAHVQTPVSTQAQPEAAAGVKPDALKCEQEWEVVEKAAQAFQAQSLSQWRNRATGSTIVHWTVDGKKLRSNDKTTVSPLFKLSDGQPNAPLLPFKMVVSPKVVSDGKGGASFRKAAGRGIIQLKCEAPRDGLESYPLKFYLSAWTGRSDDPRTLPVRGPVACDFAKSGICGLKKDNEVWDFLDVVDKTQTFVICLEIVPP
jgi:hypothetical protein